MSHSDSKLNDIERQRGRCGCRIRFMDWVLKGLVPKLRCKSMSHLFERDKYASKRSFACREIAGPWVPGLDRHRGPYK
jgi:hypothetical protein